MKNNDLKFEFWGDFGFYLEQIADHNDNPFVSFVAKELRRKGYAGSYAVIDSLCDGVTPLGFKNLLTVDVNSCFEKHCLALLAVYTNGGKTPFDFVSKGFLFVASEIIKQFEDGLTIQTIEKNS